MTRTKRTAITLAVFLGYGVLCSAIMWGFISCCLSPSEAKASPAPEPTTGAYWHVRTITCFQGGAKVYASKSSSSAALAVKLDVYTPSYASESAILYTKISIWQCPEGFECSLDRPLGIVRGRGLACVLEF